MATARSNNRRRSSASSHQRSRSRRNNEGRRPLQERDTGYRVGSSRRQTFSRGINPRLIVVGIVGLLLLIAIIFGISTCVRGCSNNTKPKGGTEQKEQKVNPDDDRVAYGVTSEVTSKLGAVLDRNETFAKIAKTANKITDERLIDLAIAEPEAIDFVVGFPKADGSTKPYDEAVTQGEYPKLFTFDERWGYATFADGVMGVTGSGPVSLSMASMGLSGKTTYDPATIAQAITAANLASGSTGMDDSFLTNHSSDAGVTATTVEVSSDGLYNALAEGNPVVIKLKADSGIGLSGAHWALIPVLNDDNSIQVFDPTSAVASSRPWALGTIASRIDSAYSLASAAGTTGVSGLPTNDGSTDEYSEEDYSEEEYTEEGY